MRCLTDVEVQAVVDGEASDECRAHAATCEAVPRASRRAAEPDGDARLADGCRRDAVIGARGSPASCDDVERRRAARPCSARRRPSPWRRLGWVSALATAAVIALVVYGVLPRLGAPTTLSASEVLSRSLQTISSGQGVETARIRSGHGRHDARPGGHPPGDRSRQPASLQGRVVSPGRRRSRQRSVRTRSRQRRSQLFHVDGTNYIVRVGAIHTPVLSIPQMAQALVETSIGIMQAKSDQQLTVEDGPNGRRYIVEIPPVTPANPTATLDIFGARAVISGADFRIQEFEATGTMLRQPFSVSVKLRTHEYIGGAATDESFAMSPGPDDVVLEGQAAEDPVTELMTTVLRELGRARGR